MKRIYLAVLSIGITICTYAQNGPLQLTRESAVSIALKNRLDKQAQSFHKEASLLVVQKSKNNWLPDLVGKAETRYNTQLEQSIIPGGIIAGVDQSELVTLTAAKNQSYMNLSLEQSIFDKDKSANSRLAKNEYLLALEKESEIDIRIKDEVNRAYLEVLLKKLQYNIALDIEKRNVNYEQLSKAKLENGKIIENDYLRTKLDRDNASTLTAAMLQRYKLALQTLCFRMNIPEQTTIELTEELTDIVKGNLIYTLKETTELKQARLMVQRDSILLKSEKQNWLPKISFNASYTYQYLNEKFAYNDQGWWSPYSFVGLKATFPLSEAIKSRPSVKEKKFHLNENQLQVMHLSSEIKYAVSKSESDLSSARQNLTSVKANYELSEKIYANHQKQFALGVFEYSDLLDTERTMRTAEQQYIETLHNYLLAALDYQKYSGNL